MMRFNGEVSIRPIVTRLKKHINIHFNFEESLMLHCNYPGYDQHKQEHQILNEKALCLIRKFNNKEEVSEENLVNNESTEEKKTNRRRK